MKHVWLALLFLLASCAVPDQAPATTPSLTSPGPGLPVVSPTHTLPATEAAPPPTDASLPIPEDPIKLPKGERVTFQAADGEILRGTFYPGSSPQPGPAVLLIHMAYGSPREWRAFIPQLTGAGYGVLAIALRDHWNATEEPDWGSMPADVQLAWETLSSRPEVDPQRTAIIGASLGANLAMVTGAAQPAVRTVVLISPGLIYYQIASMDAIQNYGKRPVLIVTSRDDTYAADSSQKLYEAVAGQAELKLYDGEVHGSLLLESQPDLGPLILDWLGLYLTGDS